MARWKMKNRIALTCVVCEMTGAASTFKFECINLVENRDPAPGYRHDLLDRDGRLLET